MTVILQDDLRLVYVKEQDVLNTVGFCRIIKDVWFVVHPETGDLLFWQSDKKRQGKLVGASPQCNASQATTEKVWSKIYPWAKFKFFERVACPIDPKDYA